MVVDDFDNDSYPDVAVTITASNEILIYYGENNLTLFYRSALNINSSYHPSSFTIGDFNNDQNNDIAIFDEILPVVLVFLGDGNFHFQPGIQSNIDFIPTSFETGDFNQDNICDLVLSFEKAKLIGVFYSHGNGSFSTGNFYSTGLQSKPSFLAVNDLNNDQILDIIVSNQIFGNVLIFLGQKNSSFNEKLTVSIASRSFLGPVVIGDFNGDKKNDFAVINYRTDSINVMIQKC